MERLLQDIRYGISNAFENARFHIVALITLALGIGANTAIFSIVNAIIFRPLPYANPDRLGVVGSLCYAFKTCNESRLVRCFKARVI